jgi:mRNA interferase RelE/StbE
MTYHWKFDSKAAKQFYKLDKLVQRRLYNWLQLNINHTDNPRVFGKALEVTYTLGL